MRPRARCLDRTGPAMIDFQFSRSDFPEGFLFSAATSAYQIEGHAFGGAGRTHWDSFAETPGKVDRGETGAIACDHFHRWKEDLDLIRDAGLDAYRFSTSWARVMPDGVNINPEGLDFYDRLVDGMLARGIRPMATLYHWELPEVLGNAGGWTIRDIPERFADFAAVIAERLGDRLHSVAPVNEPFCVSWLSHHEGYHAPGLTGLGPAAKSMHHVGLAHGLAVQALRAQGVGNVGAACNFEYALPATDSVEDRATATIYDGIYNRWFPGAMIRGEYPQDVLDGLAEHMPDNWQDDMKIISQPLDWFGVNYYTCQRIRATGAAWPGVGSVPGPLPKTDMGWEICPEGLAWLVTRLARDITGDLPLFITENGLANPDTPLRPDAERVAYLDAHLAVACDLIESGVPLTGYTFWSLLDNYEWTLGYAKRFGLVHVDFETQTRTPKASYHALARALAR
ncbi:GH1 family beta-glucosidase [Jannaschia pohangensis]|uniref:Beta-glucosidase n=1 Tax=Jannaschia pohangensis TaxID=390807 RepID=A0A1I3H3T7_9RHOB|nr:GH1 family beta-glucosidase [Jannaschia pohangensis]SFI30361.1 beta-glucosidase [Jannaschia pohangensis]